MKRSQMARKILRKLKEWQGSQLENKTAREILDVIEEAGMLPPQRNADQRSSYGYAQVWTWEPETKRKRK